MGDYEARGHVRGNALWGSGSTKERRRLSSARRGTALLATLVALIALSVPATASANSKTLSATTVVYVETEETLVEDELVEETLSWSDLSWYD